MPTKVHRPASGSSGDEAPAGWVLYVLRCADGSLYTGITSDLPRRLAAHNAGKGARYTRGRGPVEVLWCLGPLEPGRARRLEYAFKQLPRGRKLQVTAGLYPWPPPEAPASMARKKRSSRA
ncbi:MAG: GIY-YIG nuclease family protein [Polyangiaceae bacterium]|nr:GIY-YIG nuclease family protein [Polyangiaceae bacterium]